MLGHEGPGPFVISVDKLPAALSDLRACGSLGYPISRGRPLSRVFLRVCQQIQNCASLSRVTAATNGATGLAVAAAC